MDLTAFQSYILVHLKVFLNFFTRAKDYIATRYLYNFWHNVDLVWFW